VRPACRRWRRCRCVQRASHHAAAEPRSRASCHNWNVWNGLLGEASARTEPEVTSVNLRANTFTVRRASGAERWRCVARRGSLSARLAREQRGDPMTIGKGRSNPARASFSRLNLAGTVLLFACGGNDVSSPSVPPPPVIEAVFPSAVVAGSPDLTLTITGNNFVEGRVMGSHAAWVANGDTTLLATTYVGSTRLTVVIPAALLSNSVIAQVLLRTGDPMGNAPLASSNAIDFVVTDNTDASMTGTIVVYGRISMLPRRAKGSREVSLDGSPWLLLTEGQSLTYTPVAPGEHRLVLSEPCSADHAPSRMKVPVSGGQTVTVPVTIPADCE